MKLLVSLDEVTRIVEDALTTKGLKLKPGSAKVVRHTEGQYDDSCEVLDGIDFELE